MIRQDNGFFNYNKTLIPNLLDNMDVIYGTLFQTPTIEQMREYLCLGEDENIDDSEVFHMYLEDVLMYNTVYEPDIRDEEVAIEVGLPFFYFNDDMYLALGTIGMDMSPKLDAYQFLTSKSLPYYSKWYSGQKSFEYIHNKWHSDKNYFKYVVGEEVYNKMEKIITNMSPKEVEKE